MAGKMICDNLSEFISLLESQGELVRIKEPVSCELEISKFADKESKKPNGGKALLFEKVKESKFPVVVNLFGSEKRMSMALGVKNFAEMTEKIARYTKTTPPQSFKQFFETAKKFLPLLKIAPKKISGNAPCQEVVKTGEQIDLSEIPVLKCWPKDGGRFITLPLVFTKNPDTNERNLGMYRLQVFDGKTTGMHWHIHKDASHFYNLYREKNMRMPVAVAIGADPATIYAATAPLPRGIDELLLAGFFRGKGVKTVKCVSVDLEVPAQAEFVLEGYVEPFETRLEGPFGDHTGYYSLADQYPVFHLTAITHRKKPIYCATLVGPPPMEDCYMAKATERIFLPMLHAVFPEICDMFLPWEGVFHNIAVVSIKKEYPAHAQRLISALWGQGQMSFCKSIAVVDENTDITDYNALWEKFLNSFDPNCDILRGFGVLDALDHSAQSPLMGNKIGFDLTAKVKGEPPRKTKPLLDKLNDALVVQKFDFVKAAKSAKSFCALSVEKQEIKGRDLLNELMQSKMFDNIKCVAMFDTSVDIENPKKLLWKIFNNTDPVRDILIENGTLYIDACKKNRADGFLREWPDDLKF